MCLILPFTLLQTRVIHTPIGIRLGIVGGLVFCGAALILRSGFLGRRLRGLLEREREALAGVAEREAELARLNRQLAHLNRQLIDDSRRDAAHRGEQPPRPVGRSRGARPLPARRSVSRWPSPCATPTASRPTTTASATWPATRRCG